MKLTNDNKVRAMSDDNNILQQAINTMDDKWLSSNDVLWVGSACGKYAMSWREFSGLACDLVCDPYEKGGHDCAWDLVIVFDNCWLARFDECGQQGWEFMQKPTKSAGAIKPLALSGEYSPSLEVINAGRDQHLREIEDFERTIYA